MVRSSRLCIYCTGRTGSELLVELLATHPRVVCEGEILEERRVWPRRFVLGRASAAAMRGAQAYGFKLVSSQFRNTKPTPGRFVRRLADDGFQFVRLRRRNLLRQALSHMRAEDAGVYHRRDDPVRRGPLPVDVIELVYKTRFIEVVELTSDMIFEGVETHDLWYEDDLQAPEDQQRTAAELFDMLGVDVAPVRPAAAVRKLATADLREDIANYEEVTSWLRGTRFERFLDP